MYIYIYITLETHTHTHTPALVSRRRVYMCCVCVRECIMQLLHPPEHSRSFHVCVHTYIHNKYTHTLLQVYAAHPHTHIHTLIHTYIITVVCSGIIHLFDLAKLLINMYHIHTYIHTYIHTLYYYRCMQRHHPPQRISSSLSQNY